MLKSLFPSFGGRPSRLQLERYRHSPHYRNGRFHNPEPTRMNPEGVGFRQFATEMLRRHPGRRHPDIVPNLPINNKELLQNSADAFIWLGHSSLIIRFASKIILVDPVLSRRASPFRLVGPKSFRFAHDYRFDDLPVPDLVIITHDHYDHLDHILMRKLRRSGARYICPLGVAPHLEAWGVPSENISEFDWWDEAEFHGISVKALPGRHFSGRGATGRNSSLWAAFSLEANGKRVFLGGDSGYGKHFSEIWSRCGDFDLVFLECGQYNELWPWIHMSPEESVQAARNLGVRTYMPIHRGRFALGLHPWDEPIRRAGIASESAGLNMLNPEIGEIVEF